MRIDALALRNFRNYDALNVTFAPDCNVIVGENAQGKTNLLEAIVYLSSARSPRARAEKELISFGKSECSIKANAFARNRDFLLEIALAAGRRRKILINKVPVKKGSDLSDVLGAVYFCPEDLLLIRDGAAARRKFMDDALCQLRARYAQALSARATRRRSATITAPTSTKRAFCATARSIRRFLILCRNLTCAWRRVERSSSTTVRGSASD